MAIDPIKLPQHHAAPEARFAVPREEPAARPVVPEAAHPAGPDPVEVARATSRRHLEMKERGRELHFSQTDAGMRIEVYDGLGRLVQEIPTNAGMARALGRSAWEA